MQEIGINAKLVPSIIDGTKSVEIRLGTPKFLKIRTGHILSIREDVYDEKVMIESTPDVVQVRVKQLLYFESFTEAFSAVSFKDALPDAHSIDEALATYRQLYSEADEYEHGVVAMTIQTV